jgi:hypothetical protein
MGESSRTLMERGMRDNELSNSSMFQAIAAPANRLSNEIISVDYVNNRFVVTIGKYSFYPGLPDWQLVPIVYFANSSYQGTVTSAGDTQNGEAQYKYHPAFLDNLLGLRLFQANLLNIPESLGDIPKDEQGAYIYVQSEKPLAAQWRNVYEIISGELNKNRSKFTSYILTDKGENIVFDTDGKNLKFTGNPYYLFIKTDKDNERIENLRTEVETYYKEIEEDAKVFLRDKYSPALNPRTNLNGLLKVLDANRQNEVYNPYSLYFIKNKVEKLNALNRLTDEELMGIRTQTVDDFTSSFRKNWNLLKQYNPVVYTAVENTSRWAAFFRYIRLTNPNNWTAFLDKVERINLRNMPPVQTPTSIEK